MTIQTVLFDLDGTILDSNELIIKSFEYTFDYYNIVLPKEQLKEFNGPPLMETFATYNPGYEEEMVKTYRTHNHEHHEEYVKLFPQVIETIEALQERDIKMGIVTAKMRNAVQLGMELTGLDNYFQTVVTVDDVKHSKPHPESVYKAMDQLNASAQSTIIVGDNYHDILAGKNAGIRTAGVAWSHKGEAYIQSYEPTYMLREMTDLLDIIEV